MLFLIGSIILTSYLTLSFKIVERLRLNNLQVIVFNYITCVITGSVVDGNFPVNRTNIDSDWFPWACLMGTVFILLLNLIGYCAQRIGVAVTSVANKLSLVIPFLFSLYLYNEEGTIMKIAGIILALVAVFMTCYRESEVSRRQKSNRHIFYLVPFFLFIGSGLLDTMIKYVEYKFLNESNKNDYLISAFFMAAVIGILMLIAQRFTTEKRIEMKAIAMGIAIGIPNYFSLWCLIRVLKFYHGNSSAIIPINNMGIVLFSSLVAWWLFKEKLSKVNWAGVLLSVIAICLIAYG